MLWLQHHFQSSSGKVEIGSLCTLCFFRLSLGNAIIQEGTSQPEEISTSDICNVPQEWLILLVKNVMASPDLPALPDRPIHIRQKLWLVQ
jgi:hypothetical protein